MNTHEEEIATSTVPAMAHRRGLIQAMASSMILAASGLFLPARLDEVDAREGALDGARGGRRGADHRGRHKHKQRDHGDRKEKRKNQDTPRGATRDPLPITVVMTVNNYRSVPVQLQGWQFLDKGESGQFYVPREWRWSAIPARASNGSPAVKEFLGYRTHAYYSKYVIVQVGTDYVVPAFYDHFQPGAGFLVGIGLGGWDEFGPTNGGVNSVNLAAGESLSKDAIKVTRMADTKEHIRVTVDLT